MKKLILLAIAALSLVGCNTRKDNEILVGASPTPHAEILEVVKPLMKEKGYDLQIKVFDDYVTPNISLQNGDIDANYFQHTPYLEDFNKNNGTDLVGVCKVHFEPMGIYSDKHTTIKSDQVYKIAIPNDTSNKERALNLLAALKDFGYSFEYTTIELEAQTLPSVLPDVDYACINGNYALSSGILDKSIGVSESTRSDIAQQMANVIAVKRENIELPKVTALVECLKSQVVKDFIKEKYGSSVIPML